MVYYTGKPIEKGIRTTSHKQNRLIDLKTTILESRLKNRTSYFTQPFLVLKALVSTFYY